MALRACLACGCKYAVGLAACPQCWSTESEEDGVPKISFDGTVTYPSGHEPDGYVRPQGAGPEAVSEPETAAETVPEPQAAPEPVKAAVKPSPPPPPAPGGLI